MAETTRILMLGNSLTTANDMPSTLAAVLSADVFVHARGGARLAEHLDPQTKLGSRTKTALAGEPWDFLVLQEMSHAPATSPDAYLKSVTALCNQARKLDITPVIYATWAYAPNCPKLAKLGFSSDQMHVLMHETFLRAQQATGALLADAGTAFIEANDRGLWAADGVHPSSEGSKIAARAIAEAVRSARSPQA